MLRTVEEIKAQITTSLQALLSDALFEGNDTRLVLFGDEQEFKTIKGRPFPAETNACFNPFQDRFVIFLKQLDTIGSKEEADIAHELGHLWLLFLGLPSEKRSSDADKQARWDSFFSPLRDTMEHAVYYPLLKGKYQIDLYAIGNERLVDFITNQLPGIGNESAPEKLLLILNYIKYEVESDDQYWLQSLQKAYSKRAPDAMEIADNLLNLILELADTMDAQLLVSRYREVLKILDTHFGIPEKLWPDFVTERVSEPHQDRRRT
jgi:hypothetical protein